MGGPVREVAATLHPYSTPQSRCVNMSAQRINPSQNYYVFRPQVVFQGSSCPRLYTFPSTRKSQLLDCGPHEEPRSHMAIQPGLKGHSFRTCVAFINAFLTSLYMPPKRVSSQITTSAAFPNYPLEQNPSVIYSLCRTSKTHL